MADAPKASKPTRSTFSWISGARHVIVSRKAILQVLLVIVGLLGGAFVAERLRLKSHASKLKDGKTKIKGTNLRLKAEKDDYKMLFKTMAESLENWKAAGGSPHKTQMANFKETSEVNAIFFLNKIVFRP